MDASISKVNEGTLRTQMYGKLSYIEKILNCNSKNLRCALEELCIDTIHKPYDSLQQSHYAKQAHLISVSSKNDHSKNFIKTYLVVRPL